MNFITKEISKAQSSKLKAERKPKLKAESSKLKAESLKKLKAQSSKLKAGGS
jgi:hypothetical protein